ncbi:HD domain-containing phosphohydrolase [Herbivorax sp. ANBcel31]|uniref:HD-GYP domain-containing protein n=1 Tax=Herbivorax sp. ANBcel31 TaxID=3069754 RepID=UPI0027AE74D9|nr:HD domain-containing phosphohydrolase [Herbivorax sp. ANBcel31]MDQ2086728.1 HD domain-containing phosphohydrolase [Herbivorax sp. ANBcel31]
MILYILNRLMGRGAFHEVIDQLVTALEKEDPYTGGHSSNVADMSMDLSKEMGIKGIGFEDIHLAAHLHDIGKLNISQNIINKKGMLLPKERIEIEKHPYIGFNILNKSKNFKNIAKIVLYHHERWDGTGYPEGLLEDNIPIGSRIIAVADSIDAMTTDRPYRKAMTWRQCIEEINLNASVQFDPLVVEAANKLWDKWKDKKLFLKGAFNKSS